MFVKYPWGVHDYIIPTLNCERGSCTWHISNIYSINYTVGISNWFCQYRTLLVHINSHIYHIQLCVLKYNLMLLILLCPIQILQSQYMCIHFILSPAQKTIEVGTRIRSLRLLGRLSVRSPQYVAYLKKHLTFFFKIYFSLSYLSH